jgi:hypothetical protein
MCDLFYTSSKFSVSQFLYLQSEDISILKNYILDRPFTNTGSNNTTLFFGGAVV